MLKEFIISYRAGTSPYWYNKSLYAADAAEARELFMVRRDLCPYNVRGIKVKEV